MKRKESASKKQTVDCNSRRSSGDQQANNTLSHPVDPDDGLCMTPDGQRSMGCFPVDLGNGFRKQPNRVSGSNHSGDVVSRFIYPDKRDYNPVWRWFEIEVTVDQRLLNIDGIIRQTAVHSNLIPESNH